jgi:hypothetical protein
MALLALNGHSNRAHVCPLLDQSGQTWILARDRLSAYDPTATLAVHCGIGFDAVGRPYATLVKAESRAVLASFSLI